MSLIISSSLNGISFFFALIVKGGRGAVSMKLIINA